MSWSSAIGKAFGSVGSLMNSITGTTGQMDKSYKQQMSAMNMQNAYNTKMWNMQNEYNSPVSQFARMREAGIDINPTSYALGTGNLSNTAVKVDSAGGFAGSGSPAGNPISMLMGVASGVQGLKESKARTEVDNAQSSNLTAQKGYTEEHTRQMKNENDFFEKHGYYPPHGDTPALSSYDTGPVPAFYNIWNEAHKRAREKYKKQHPDYNGW